MATGSQFAPVAFSLTAMFSWGTSDFIGGYAARKANAFLLTTIAHASGTALMLGLALSLHSQVPPAGAIRWAMAAGLLGGVSLAIFYHALSLGQMGLTAPVAAVLGAAVPTVFYIFTQGMPGNVPIVGFVIAGIGIWLISRGEGQRSKPEGLTLAVLSGIGFAGFFLCIKPAGDVSVLWAAAFSRSASLLATGLIVLLTRQFRPIGAPAVAWGTVAGLLDVTGTAVFIRASQMGRLDAAVVISSLYPAITVLMARLVLKEHFSRWKKVGLLAALVAVPMIAW